MSIVNFNKLESLKRLLNKTLLDLGMKERVQVINDNDLDNIISVMITVEGLLKKFDTEDKKIEYLEKYILCLLCILQVDYGVNIRELK